MIIMIDLKARHRTPMFSAKVCVNRDVDREVYTFVKKYRRRIECISLYDFDLLLKRYFKYSDPSIKDFLQEYKYLYK